MSADDDIARVGWVLENYDDVELLTESGEQIYSSEFLDTEGEPAPQIRFRKRIDGTYYVVEAAFEAIPYVLKNGQDISSHSNHKGRNYDTITIAAPVIINGRRGNMAVVVKLTDENRYKVHRILTPDGSVFNLSEEENEAESTTAGGVTKNGSLATPKDTALSDTPLDGVQLVNSDALHGVSSGVPGNSMANDS